MEVGADVLLMAAIRAVKAVTSVSNMVVASAVKLMAVIELLNPTCFANLMAEVLAA